MSLADVEDAIRAWVKTTSGLADRNVYFADQKVERPTGAYATIRLDGLESMGAVDPVMSYYDAGRPAGMELELRVEGQRALHVTVAVYGAPTTDTAGDTYPIDLAGSLGQSSAVEIASRIRTAIQLPTIRGALTAAGLSPIDIGTVQNLGTLLGTIFDGRAQFEVEFYLVETASEYTGYVETVEVETVLEGDVVGDGDGTITVP